MRSKADPAAPASDRPHTTPSTNGPDGSPSCHDTPDAPPASGRDARGRFAQGNRGGPGNPFARQVAGLRQALLDVVTEEDMEAIARELVRQAREGNLAAMKLLFSYTLGRPAEAVNPDTLELEEWEQYRRGAQAGPELPAVVKSMPLGVACHIQRVARPAMEVVYGQNIRDGIQAFEQQGPQAREQQEEPEAGAGREKPAGKSGRKATEPGRGAAEDPYPARPDLGLPRGLTEAEWLASLGTPPLPDWMAGGPGAPAPTANGGNGRGSRGAPSANGGNGS